MLLVMMQADTALRLLQAGPANCLYVSEGEESARKAAKVYVLDINVDHHMREALLDALCRFHYREGGNDEMPQDESI